MLLAFSLLSTAFAAGAVAVSPEVDANVQAPCWSPDGGKLAYELNYYQKKTVELYIIDHGKPPVKVNPVARGASGATAGFNTTAGTAAVVAEVSWAPASLNSFVFTAAGPDRDLDLWLYPSTKLATSPGADGGAAWSPDGKLIAFTSARSGEGDIYLLDASDLAGAPRQITREPTSSELYVAWSPDSKKLAYVAHDKVGDSIYLVDNLSSPAPKAIVRLGNTQTHPTFSPDGSQIAFYSNHEDPSRFDLYVAPLGGQPRLLSKGVVINVHGPQWMPDGQSIVFVADDDNRFDPVLQVPVAGGPAKPVPTRTVGNGDHDLVKAADGTVWLAVAAQGELKGTDRDFKRVFIMQMP